jgi:ketosteroid isomerase-like protein
MTTQEIAQKIIDYVKEGKNLQAEEELYADDVISVEQNGYTAKGKEAVMAKTKAAMEGNEETYGGGVTEAYIGADNFLFKFEIDMKPKGGERMTFKEWGFYKVKDGKVSEEYFLIEPMAIK